MFALAQSGHGIEIPATLQSGFWKKPHAAVRVDFLI
jgi:hypothetical protein